MKKFFLLFLSGIFLNSCTNPCKTIHKSRNLIRDGKAECVLIANNRMYAVARGRGVNPLLHLYDTQREQMCGGMIVDKVIGRAAAAIAICGKVKQVHGEVMSEDALADLQTHGIKATYTTLVPRILNRTRDGLCPLEQSVQGITDPEEELAALRKKIESFKK